MPDILPWNNAFGSGGGGGGGVPVQPMTLPPPGSVDIAGAIARGQGIAASRQNMAAQAQQMDQSAQMFPLQMQEAQTQIQSQQQNMLLQMYALRQKQELGNIWKDNIDPATGQPNYTGVALGIAKSKTLASIAPEAMQNLYQTKGFDADAVGKELQNGIARNNAVAGYLQPLLAQINVGQHVTAQDVANTLAKAAASGLITSREASQFASQMSAQGTALDQQIRNFAMSNMTDKEMLARNFGTLNSFKAGGSTVQTTDVMTPQGMARVQTGQTPDTATVAEQQAGVQVQDAHGNLITVPAGSDAARAAGVGIRPDQMPGGVPAPVPGAPEYSVPKSLPPVLQTAYDKDYTKYEAQRTALDEQASVISQTVPYLENAKELIKRVDVGPGTTSIKEPLAAFFTMMGRDELAKKVVGGDLGALQQFNFTVANLALGFYKRNGIANRDLSANEIQTAAMANFTPNYNRTATTALIKFMLEQAKYIQAKQDYYKSYAQHVTQLMAKDPAGTLQGDMTYGNVDAAWNSWARKQGWKELTAEQKDALVKNAPPPGGDNATAQ
jgi:hypothetical protein